MTDFSICRNRACAARVEGEVGRCPQCGGGMAQPRWIRQTGWLMSICGALISLPTIVLVIKFMPVVLDPEAAVAAGRFGGSAGQVPLATALLLTVLAVGLSLLGFGAPRALFGTRSAMAKPVLLGLGLLFFAIFFYLGSQLPDQPAL